MSKVARLCPVPTLPATSVAGEEGVKSTVTGQTTDVLTKDVSNTPLRKTAPRPPHSWRVTTERNEMAPALGRVSV